VAVDISLRRIDLSFDFAASFRALSCLMVAHLLCPDWIAEVVEKAAFGADTLNDCNRVRRQEEHIDAISISPCLWKMRL
jgi:hypothetical protein